VISVRRNLEDAMDEKQQVTYLTTRELAERIKYKPNVVNNMNHTGFRGGLLA
jgi:ribosome-binding protein aMBF1 (putative translation factor)